jgi:hypothetical protein
VQRRKSQEQEQSQQGYRPPRDLKVRQAATQPMPRLDMPTILTRGALGTPLLQRTRTKPRRKVSIPMDTPGTEMVLPSLPFANPGWRVLSGIWFLLSVAIILLLSYDPMYRISEVSFAGIESINPGDVEIFAGLKGQQAFAINPAVIEDRLQRAFPELMDVSIKVSMPGTALIAASEREPVILWKYHNQEVLIDMEGVVFPRRGQAGVDELLVIVSDMPPPAPPTEELDDIEAIRQEVEQWESGEATAADLWEPQQTDPALVEAALNLQPYLPPETALVYSHYDGLGWSDSRGWNVFVGLDLDEIEFKMAEYDAIVDHLQQKGIRPRMISVEHVHAPFYRLE